jgi:hypothetical protein
MQIGENSRDGEAAPIQLNVLGCSPLQDRWSMDRSQPRATEFFRPASNLYKRVWPYAYLNPRSKGGSFYLDHSEVSCYPNPNPKIHTYPMMCLRHYRLLGPEKLYSSKISNVIPTDMRTRTGRSYRRCDTCDAFTWLTKGPYGWTGGAASAML